MLIVWRDERSGVAFNPASLFCCLRDGNAAGGAETFDRCLGVEAAREEQACGNQSSSADALAAVQQDVATCDEFSIQLIEGQRETPLGIGDFAICDGKGEEADALSLSCVSFAGEIEVAFLMGLEKRDDGIDPAALPVGDLVRKPIPATRTRGKSKPARPRSLYPMELRSGHGVIPLCG